MRQRNDDGNWLLTGAALITELLKRMSFIFQAKNVKLLYKDLLLFLILTNKQLYVEAV